MELNLDSTLTILMVVKGYKVKVLVLGLQCRKTKRIKQKRLGKRKGKI